MRISTSLTLNAQNQLARTSQAIARSLERLSSGRRVSSAKDDQAVFSMGIRLDSQIRGLRQGLQNINHAQGMVETAGSAIQSQMDIVRRMRELAVQASNGTLTSSDRENLNKELTVLFSEFKRITETTEFNGQKLLDGSLSSSLQIGPDATDQVPFSLNNLSASQVFQQTTGTNTFSNSLTFNLTASHGQYQAVGDINGDGHQDILFQNVDSGLIYMYLGDGAGNFTAGGTLTTGYQGGELTLGDINGDGILDIVAADANTTSLSIFIGKGDGSFESRMTVASANGSKQIDLGDINGDGILDIVTADYTAGEVSILLGNGDGSFQARTTVTVGTNPRDILLRDINNDGKMDIIASDNGDDTISMLLGNGDGSFQARTTLGTGVDPTRLAMADVNNDGYLDLFVVDSHSSAKTISFYLNNGNGTFGARQTLNTFTTALDVQLADMNNDGILDVVTSAASVGTKYISIYSGDGSGGFSLSAKNSVSATSRLSVADFNEDGVLDIITTEGSTTGYFYSAVSQQQFMPSALDISTQDKAQTLLGILDTAFENLKNEQSKISALHNRLDSAASANLLLSESLDEARSRSQDLDIAYETAELVKQQILQQAQVSVLAQANLQMQTVLKLLEFND